ncbi:hypothetical protein KCU78_g60, partial [Aureobasidium melanogenum]
MPSRGGSIILTTRLIECKILGTGANLDDLGRDTATQLLLRACGYGRDNQETHIPAAKVVVSTLGQHALALVHAGAYIKKGLCTLDEYVLSFRKEQARLMKFNPQQQASRYGSVYATFEVSAEALASSEDHDCALALRLLSLLAFLNREAVEEDIFSRASDQCHKMEKAWKKNGMQYPKYPTVSSMEYDRVTDELGRIDHLHIWHCEKARSSGVVEHQATTRLRFARTRLADLSLIRVDDNKISMHPLVHEWARTRLDKAALTIAWEQTMSILALSAVDLYWPYIVWRGIFMRIQVEIQTHTYPHAIHDCARLAPMHSNGRCDWLSSIAKLAITKVHSLCSSHYGMSLRESRVGP